MTKDDQKNKIPTIDIDLTSSEINKLTDEILKDINKTKQPNKTEEVINSIFKRIK